VIDPQSITLRHGAVALASLAISLLVLAVPSVVGAAAPTAADGTFSISPSRRDLAGKPPASLVPTKVTNTTKESYDVQAFAVLLRQDLTGAFQFSETPRSLTAARTILGVSPSRFRLSAGSSRVVKLRWALLPRGARAAYIGVVFQGQARAKSGKSVPVVTRLLSINFLRRPGRYHPNGVFTALNATQFAPRVLRFLARVKNTGDIVGTPKRGRITIRDANGRTVYNAPWTGDVVLPGAQRDFPIDLRKVLPAGRYTVRTSMSFGANPNARISSTFTLAGPNQLTSPAVKITGFAVKGDAGSPARVSGKVRSIGTAPATVDLALSLSRVSGGQPAPKPFVRRQLRFSALAPGSSRSLDLDLTKRLAKGKYHAVLTYADPTGAPQELTSDFAASPRRSLIDRLKLFFDRHRSLIIGGIALVVVAGIVLRLMRRQRRLEAELREAKAQRDKDPPPE